MAGEKFYSWREVKEKAVGAWPSILARLGCDVSLLTNVHSACPGCGGNDRFRFDDKDGTGSWLCSGGGNFQSGDGLALVQHIRNVDWKEAAELVGEILGLGKHGAKGGFEEGVVIRPPRAREAWIPPFSMEKLRGVVRGVPEVTEEWLMERSPVPVKSITGPGDFLEAVFEPGERVMVFTEFKGPGDYLWEVGRGGFRLSPDQGVKAVPSKLPVECGKDGAWFLSNPVSGKWYPNPRRDGRPSRRSQEAVTAWKYLVLECDEEKTLRKKAHLLREAAKQADAEKWLAEVKADARWVAEMMPLRSGWLDLAQTWERQAPEVSGLWLKFMAMAPLPIAALCTSGGASVHALVRDPKENWPEFSELIREYKKRVPLLGADPGALTPVRLTRLPGCKRNGKFQKLLYLDPKADTRPIYGR